MAKKKVESFPKVLFVKRDYDKNGSESWLTTGDTAQELAEFSEDVEVAVYKLERIGKVSVSVTGP